MDPPSAVPQERIRIYRTLDPSPISAARDRLAQIFAGRPEDSKVTFNLSKEGTRLWFADNRVLWRTVDPGRLPANRTAAEVAARTFIGRINTAVQRDHDLATAGISRLFPDDMRPSVIAMASDPDRGIPDHWIIRFNAYLLTGASAGSALVFGAVTDIRVGQDGAIGGCWLAWRQCVPQGLTSLLPLPQPDDTADIEATSEVPAPVLVYVLADEGVAQSYISPYYFVPNDDDGDFLPASLYSPVAKIVDDPSSETPRVMAQVLGGSRDSTYRWAGWDLANPQDGWSDLGSGDGVELEPGSYNIMLQVTDPQPTPPIVLYVERLVFTAMFASAQASGLPANDDSSP